MSSHENLQLVASRSPVSLLHRDKKNKKKKQGLWSHSVWEEDWGRERNKAEIKQSNQLKEKKTENILASS